MERRARDLLGRRAPKSLPKLIGEILEETATPYSPPPDQLTRIVLDSPAFEHVWRSARRAAADRPVLDSAKSARPGPLQNLPIPNLASPGELADWLELSLSHLDWYADERRQHGNTAEPALQHYAYRWLPKRSGPPRLIEASKPRLKEIQRKILHDILDHLPAHDSAHGFIAGRSCLGAAQVHAGEHVVTTVDLKDFFLTIPPARVHSLFRNIGYTWHVARLLTGLCTISTPATVFDGVANPHKPDWAARNRYREPHLPQGAPTSPALANLCCWRLDCRLTGLAGRLDARYTRYADDLTFSGDATFDRAVNPFLAKVAEIAKSEGFALNDGKTRVMHRGGRQSVTGLVVNDHINVPRAAYDQLKATLHNCARYGPKDQNRDRRADFCAHLDGRVAWVEAVNPIRGHKLRLIFDRIAWP